MPITTLSSRQFRRNVHETQNAALSGPVFITEHGRPTHVLLSYDAYQRLSGARRNIAEALSMPGLADVELDVSRAGERARPADFD